MSTWASKMKNTIQTIPGKLRRNSFANLVLLVALSCGSYFFFSRVVVTAMEVKGSSMSPTLVSGDMVILNRFANLTRVPQRGELVVLKDPENGDLVVKRVIGLPEESVQMSLDHAYVNGQLLPEPYLIQARKQTVASLGRSVVVPKGHFFVLGDNRNNSVDSRAFGTVARENIIGIVDL